MDSSVLATAAVTTLAPYLAETGKSAAKKLGEEAVAESVRLLNWMREKLSSGRGKEALDDLVEHPEREDNQADLRKQLTKLLESDATLAVELQSLLPPDPGEVAGAMSQNVSGAGAKAIQTRGAGNTSTIS